MQCSCAFMPTLPEAEDWWSLLCPAGYLHKTYGNLARSPVHVQSCSPASFLSGRLPICLQTTSLIGVGKCFDFKKVCNTWKTTLRFKGGRKRDDIQMLLSRSQLPALSCLRKKEWVAAGSGACRQYAGMHAALPSASFILQPAFEVILKLVKNPFL